jgi:hypothetical protein
MKILEAALLAALIIPTAVHAEDYVETFDGSVPAVMLNGALTTGVDGIWTTSVDGGSLTLSNSSTDAAVHYISMQNVVYPGSLQPMATTGASIEVKVLVRGTAKAGAGVIARFDPRTKNYMLFTIGGSDSTYYVLARESGGAKKIAAGVNPAIRQGEVNTVSLTNIEGALSFSVNGTELARIPAATTGEVIPRPPTRVTPPDSDMVGVGAFGQGTFQFDEVRVIPGPNVVGPALPAGDRVIGLER